MKFIYQALLVVFCYASSYAQNPIVGAPIRVGRLEFAQFDFPKAMTWKDAKLACLSLGQGWRLTSVSELMLLGQSSKKFKLSSFYWCIDENKDYDFPEISNGYFSASSLSMDWNKKSSEVDFWFNKGTDVNKLLNVRAVRNYSPPYSKSEIIGTPIKLNNFEIAQFDFPA
jgi:hypothetical protein